MTDQQYAARPALIERVKAILLSPKTEWAVVAAEPATIGSIFRNYVVPLAAIGPVATLIGILVVGDSLFGVTSRPSILGAVATAFVSYALALGGTFATALVIEALAPQFGAIKDRTRAYKVAAYGATAAWVAGIFGLLPMLGILSTLGLYSFYLLWLGVPAVMKPPADKATSYTLVSIFVMVVVGFVLAVLAAPVAALFKPAAGDPAGETAGETVSGALTVPGVRSVGAVDLRKAEAASERIEARSQAIENGTARPPIPGATLQALLPAMLPGGLTRTSVENSVAIAAGIGGSQALARYGTGDREIRLSITDMGAMGAMGALATPGSASGVESSRSATDDERIGKVDGRMTTEKFDRASRSGSYTTIVAERFRVEAEGSAPSIGALKAAAVAVDFGRVAALAR